MARLEEKKKPGRYFAFEYIDLTPRALAQALVLGRLDGVQTFRSMDRDYEVHVHSVRDANRDRVSVLMQVTSSPSVETRSGDHSVG